MKTDKFAEAYRKLNQKQREAVDAIDGPVMVIAGPGTGKTTILSLRIANILRKTDSPPDAILALTFTESGVRSMRKKLLEVIGPRAYRVHVHTFHGLANEIIKTYPDKFPRIIGSEHIEDLEQIRLVDELLGKGEYEYLRPKGDPLYYVRKIIDVVKNLKKDGILPDALEKRVSLEEQEILSAHDLRHESGRYAGEMKGAYRERLESIAKNKELVQAYRDYELLLEKSRLYDYEDMISEVVKALESDSDLRLRLQEEYQYVLADEHQDANKSQNLFLELLSSFHENPNLFVVGDEKQAIFRFQGASLENFLYFKSRFPTTKLIVLDENFRSHQIILDAAHALIEHNTVDDRSLRTELKSVRSIAPEKLVVAEAPDRLSELFYIAERITELRSKGVPLKEMAILVRDNAHAGPVEHELRRHGISVARLASADVLGHPYLDGFLTLMQAVSTPADESIFIRAAFVGFLKVDPIALSRILSRRLRGEPLLELLAKHQETKAFAAHFRLFAELAHREPLVEAFERIALESGFIDFLVAHTRSHELLPLYAGLLDAVVRHAERDKKATLADFMRRLESARAHGHTIAVSPLPPEGVQLLTAHGSKGLEFDHVFIVHVLDGIWGGRKSRSAFSIRGVGSLGSDIEDERRLFYVALTRARQSVTLSFFEHTEDGKEKSPSQFVAELALEHVQRKLVEPISLESAVKPTPGPKTGAFDKSYLNGLFLERGFSVTHLNNYLSCPWRYFFVDLLRVPKPLESSAIYGLAMHGALKYYFDAYAREEDVTVSQVASFIENLLWRSALSDKDFKQHAREGKKEVQGYLQSRHFSRAIFNEMRISGVPFSIGDTEIVLTGILDKVEMMEGSSVHVIDYKTGTPKSRNDILGKTKNSDGNYHRQLLFYKLLLDQYKDGEWKMKAGTIDFIKPDKKGSYHSETFDVADGDEKVVAEEIRHAAREILELSFWERFCDDRSCPWCRLRRQL